MQPNEHHLTKLEARWRCFLAASTSKPLTYQVLINFNLSLTFMTTFQLSLSHQLGTNLVLWKACITTLLKPIRNENIKIDVNNQILYTYEHVGSYE